MTRYLAMTTCNEQQWRGYGKAMVTTFDRYWPADDVQLAIYAEGFTPDVTGWLLRDLNEAAPWLPIFKTLYADPKFRGMVNGKYDYHWDAVKFAHKVAAIGAAAEGDDCDVLIWIDADIITFAQVTTEWLDRLLPLSATVGWVGRATKYPDTGFLMFRLPAARRVIRAIVKAYRGGAIFNLPETHDGYVIGHYVDAAAKRGQAIIHSFSDLSLPKRHPFINCEISTKMDHLKGRRKELGRSPKHERIIKDDVGYWK